MKNKKRPKSPKSKPEKRSSSVQEKSKKRSVSIEPRRTLMERPMGEFDKVMEELTEEQLEKMIRNMTLPLPPFKQI